ncbi:MAG: hypothetical protein JNM74_03450 [Myxococcales bacterium]|nr:hypothetical protein [Myxococcales bacterium]
MRNRTLFKTKTSFRGVGLAAVAALLVGAGSSVTACETGTSADQAVVTSLTVRAADVTRSIGCGRRPGEVYKYVAVGRPVTENGLGNAEIGGLFDCFADATFVSPPLRSLTTYEVTVTLFDLRGYEAQAAAIDAALANVGALRDLPGSLGTLTCTGTVRDNVQAFAACKDPSGTVVPVVDASLDASDATSDSNLDASDATTDAQLDASDATTD